MSRVLVVGGGHNGLVAACYLARAGQNVLVLEQADRLGGGSRTDELLPGYRFDTHSVAHNLLHATDILDDLELAEVGLRYREMDPFSVAVFADGRILPFFRSVERTVEAIAAHDPAQARAYAAWMREAMPLVRLMQAGLQTGTARSRRLRESPELLIAAASALRRNGGPTGMVRMLLQPYGRLLAERFDPDLLPGPVSAFAAHASASPDAIGGASFALWQAFYHQIGQWHGVGGSQALPDALAERLIRWGGRWRTDAAVARIHRRGDRVTAVTLASGERIDADAVLTAINPRRALLELLDPPLSGPAATRLRAARGGNAVQMIVHLATSALPAYSGARAGTWNGLQSFVDGVGALAAGFARAEARLLPADPVPTYAFTPSALDDTLAPPDHHTVYLACPCAPFEVDGGWAAAREGFAERMIDTVEARAPGFRESILGRSIRTPALMAEELCWPGAHPMHLDISLNQLGFLRPTRALGGHLTPVAGLAVSGAGTSPVGGVSGVPGREAAAALLRALRNRRR